MPQELSITPAGLYTFPNNFSKVPEGAWVAASNVVIGRDGIVNSRRGFNTYSTSLGSTVTHSQAITSFQDTIIIHKAVTNALAYDDGSGTFIDYSGTFMNPSTEAGSRIRFTQANKNLYFTTNDGVHKLDSVTGSPVNSGAPQAFGGTGVTTGATGFMDNNTTLA